MFFRQMMPTAAVVVLGASVTAFVLAGPVEAGASKADVQWAQTILKDKGLYKGRASGDLNDQTRSALRTYQKAAGLKQSGTLDEATTAHMLARRKAQVTSGNLAGSDGKPRSARPQPAAEPPKPSAAPRTRVESSGSFQGEQILGVMGSARQAERIDRSLPPRSGAVAGLARTAGSKAGMAEPKPQAAPRARVDAGGSAAAPPGMASAPDPAPSSAFTAPAWIRSVLIGILVAAFAVAGGVFWLSGRRSIPVRKGDKASVGLLRREPTFGPRPTGGEEVPVLRARRP